MSDVPQAPQESVPPPDFGTLPQSGFSPAAPPPAASEPTIPPEPPQPAVMPPPDQAFVVPSAPPNANPFIPQIAPENTPNQAPVEIPASPPPPTGNPWMKRFLLIGVILIVMAVLVLVLGKLGIGGSSLSGNANLTYWGLWENNATMQSVLASFETAHPNVKVTYTQQSPQQYRERLQAALDRGDGPDVFRFHNTWVPMLAGDLSTAPSTIMTVPQFNSTFYPVANDDLVGGSAIYGMPIMIDGLGLYYNEDLFASAGVTPPTTWEDVLNIVPKLTVKNDTTIVTSAIALGTTSNVENYSDIMATMMLQNGAKLSIPSDSKAQEALVFYRKFSNPSDPVYTWNDSMDNSIYAFANGKVAMILAPSWRVFDIKQMNPQLNFKVVPIPQLPGNTINWASYWVEGVSSKSKHQAQAWELVQYMTSKDVVTKFYTEAAKTRLFGEPYARVDLGNTIVDDPYVGAYIKEAPTDKSFPLASRTFDNGINDKLIKYLGDAVNAVGGGTSPGDALNTAASGFAQVFSSYGLTTGPAPTTTP